jgi:hypothetical protein
MSPKLLEPRLALPVALFNLGGLLVGGVIGILVAGHSFASFFVGAFVGGLVCWFIAFACLRGRTGRDE